MAFVQLQITSTNSLMKSTLTIQELITHAKHQGYQALALTDHNVLYGAIEFYETARAHNIQPIIGLTLDVTGVFDGEKSYPLILLAKNYEGYQALLQLSTLYQLKDQQVVSLVEVISRGENLIVITPGEKGEIASLLQHTQLKKAEQALQYFLEKFPTFYLGVSLQKITQELLSFYQKKEDYLVALGNVQYLQPEDALPSKVLQVLEADLPLGEGYQSQINEFLKADTGDYSLKAPREMATAFTDIGLEAAVETTKKIAAAIDLTIDLNVQVMPTYPTPAGEPAENYLKKLCAEALEERLAEVTDAYLERLSNELAVITTMGFADYFLIVWDIIRYAHQQNIYTGSGRGSAAGSLVAYLLKITNVDPIQYNLLFERFLNKERFTMPDIDLDFPDNQREIILKYIHEKYGNKKVAQIGTIGTYGAKSAVRDVARVLGASQAEIKEWAKAIPSGPNMTLETLEEENRPPQLNTLINKNKHNRKIFEIAKKIEGRNRHVSTHAAAVVISDHPLIEQTPLQKGSTMHLTQYAMEAIEKVGLLKLDILGLRNLTILSDCIRFIPYENEGRKIDIDKIPFDDKATLEIFQQGQTDGIFQFESEGIRRVLRKLQPQSFEDIVAVNALYRPGPMEQIDTFIRRKNGQEPIRYPHKDLQEILELTYGVMVYQEQVMQVASKMAGYTLNEADILRRAISKKNHRELEEGRRKFVEGAVKNKYAKETALEVYGYIERFADYGFNRSHAVAYSKVAYQLAYVKANFPASFFAAIMKASSKNKIKFFVAEAKQDEVRFLQPHVNKSFNSFIIEEGQVRFGLDSIKGLPRNFTREIIKERSAQGEYTSLLQFLNRMDPKWLSEEQIRPLIYSGAFDDLGETRNSLLYSLSSIVESIKMSHGNMELFEIFTPTIEKQPELTDEEKMKQEFEITGFYFTAEPGEKYSHLRKNPKVKYLTDCLKNQYVAVLVAVEQIKTIQTKVGEPMSFVEVIDSSDKGSLTLFPRTHRQYIQNFKEKDTVLVEGKVENTEGPIKIIVNKLTNAEELLKKQTGVAMARAEKRLYIRFKSLEHEQKKLEDLLHLLRHNQGQVPVVIFDQETNRQKVLKKEYSVKVTPHLLEQLEAMFGKKHIVLKKMRN